jgi:hypothetical protein
MNDAAQFFLNADRELDEVLKDDETLLHVWLSQQVHRPASALSSNLRTGRSSRLVAALGS